MRNLGWLLASAIFLLGLFAPALAQTGGLPSRDRVGLPINWISVGSVTDPARGQVQVYYANYIRPAPRDYQVLMAIVFSSEQSDTNVTGPFWGIWTLVNINCDTDSDSVTSFRNFFDQRGQYVVSPPSSEPDSPMTRIPPGSPADAVFRRICQ
jgi:hypothetical protein